MHPQKNSTNLSSNYGKALNLEKEKSYKLAVIIEFIHTATLLHDDVVDLSGKRRGKDTVNKVWGNEASVLVGDFLYSRSFEIMVELKDMEIMKILSHATNTIAKRRSFATNVC